MSYPSASSRLPQIDVIDQVGRAYRTGCDNFQTIVEMALLPFLIVLATLFVAALIAHGAFAGMLVGAMHALSFLIFGSVFMVRWYRFLLLDERVACGMIPPGWTIFMVASIKLVAVIVAGWVVLALVGMLPPHVLTAPLTLIAGLVLTLAALRVSLIFPAAAVERPIGLRTAWGWIEDNYWRLFACGLASYFPFLVADRLVGAAGAFFPPPLWIVFEAARLALSFLGAAVIGALLSQLYRDIGANSGPI